MEKFLEWIYVSLIIMFSLSFISFILLVVLLVWNLIVLLDAGLASFIFWLLCFCFVAGGVFMLLAEDKE